MFAGSERAWQFTVWRKSSFRTVGTNDKEPKWIFGISRFFRLYETRKTLFTGKIGKPTNATEKRSGQIPNACITKAFSEDIAAVNQWSRRFYASVRGSIGFVKGDLYHLWHGDINKRQYLKRIQDFTGTTKGINQRDKNGLHIATKDEQRYVRRYFEHREVSGDDDFLTSMAIGYVTDSTLAGYAVGGNLSGAILGDVLRNDDTPSVHASEPVVAPEQHAPAHNTNDAPAEITTFPDEFAATPAASAQNFS